MEQHILNIDETMAGKLIDVRHKESAKWQCKLQQVAILTKFTR